MSVKKVAKMDKKLKVFMENITYYQNNYLIYLLFGCDMLFLFI